MLRAVIANKLGKAIVALSAFGDARGYLYSSTASDSLLLELDAYQGLMALSSGDIETATALALGALECAALRPRIMAREILAQVCAVKDDFEGQLAYCEANLTELLASPLDKFLLTSTLKNVAILAQQQDRVDRYKDLKAEADKMDFVGLNKIFESDLYRELGLLSARHGDHLTAFRYLRRSAATAPATISELWAVLDGAAVAREIGESFASADRLAHAEELAATVDWASTAMDQRLILFVLAEEQAHANPRAARNTLDAVTKMTRGVAGSAGPMVDRRFQALLMRATGIVLKYEGSRGLAGSYLRQSFEYWLSIGFTWEAAVTALEALEVNGDSAYADYLKKYMARMPSQYLERRLEQITSCKEVLAS